MCPIQVQPCQRRLPGNEMIARRGEGTAWLQNEEGVWYPVPRHTLSERRDP